MLFGQLKPGFARFVIGANYDSPHALLLHARQHRGAVGVVLGQLEVKMRVKDFHPFLGGKNLSGFLWEITASFIFLLVSGINGLSMRPMRYSSCVSSKISFLPAARSVFTSLKGSVSVILA